MPPCSIPKYPSRPFLDQTVCWNSGGLVIKFAVLSWLRGVKREWSIENAWPTQPKCFSSFSYGKLRCFAMDIPTMTKCLVISKGEGAYRSFSTGQKQLQISQQAPAGWSKFRLQTVASWLAVSTCTKIVLFFFLNWSYFLVFCQVKH